MLIKEFWGTLLANGHDNCPCCAVCGKDLACESACSCMEWRQKPQEQLVTVY